MKTRIILLLIILLGFAVRIYQSNYPSLLWDEASLGYNAYSLLKTGKDEYGKYFPLIFKSFGDYKPGAYVYLDLPFVAILGLTPLSTRLPSIILGSLTPLLIFALIRHLFPEKKLLPLLTAAVLAFNPYNVHFSRGAWETNILTFELLLATLFFLKNHYTLSSLVFADTLYTYQAGKLITLLLIISIFLIYRPQIKKLLINFFLPLGVLALPILWGVLFSQNGNRLNVISLSSYPRSLEETQTITQETNQTDYQIFHSQPIFFLRGFLGRYFNHFSPKFLAFVGDWQNPRHSAPYVGVLLYPSLIFLMIGLISVFSRIKNPGSRFFLLWLFLAPLPSALTRDSVQAVRAMSFSIPLVFFVALGLNQTIIYLKKSRFRHLLYMLIFSSYALSFFYYSDLYLNHMVKKSPSDFLYGYQQASTYVISHQSEFQHIYFTNFYGQPYIYYLFFSSYPPVNYQKQAKLVEDSRGDTGQITNIDNIEFGSTDLGKVTSNKNSLGIFSYDEILRQGINKMSIFSKFIPLSPINGYSTFYAFQNP